MTRVMDWDDAARRDLALGKDRPNICFYYLYFAFGDGSASALWPSPTEPAGVGPPAVRAVLRGAQSDGAAGLDLGAVQVSRCSNSASGNSEPPVVQATWVAPFRSARLLTA